MLQINSITLKQLAKQMGNGSNRNYNQGSKRSAELQKVIIKGLVTVVEKISEMLYVSGEYSKNQKAGITARWKIKQKKTQYQRTVGQNVKQREKSRGIIWKNNDRISPQD